MKVRDRRIDDPEFAAWFWSHVQRGEGCWLWQPPQGRRMDYGHVLIWRSDRQFSASAHRVAYELTHGAIPVGLHVCHHCDTPPCVRPDHLFLGTPKDNSNDARRKGRLGKGRISTPGVARVTPIRWSPDEWERIEKALRVVNRQWYWDLSPARFVRCAVNRFCSELLDKEGEEAA